jgi:protein-disulfide isomerase
MRYQVRIFWLLLVMSASVAAQQKPSTGAAKPGSPAKAHTAASNSGSSMSNLPTEEEVNAFLQAQIGWEPQTTWKIVSIKPSKAAGLAEVSVQISGAQGQGAQTFFVSADGRHAVFGDIVPFGKHPFEEARLELQKKAKGPSRGPAIAPVTIVEFSDLQCPHCKDANPTVEKLLAAEPNIHFILQNFPLPMHNWALKGASYADCVGRASQDAFWKFISGVYAAQTEITAENADQKLTDLADQAGVKGTEIAACSTQPETQTQVENSINLGKSVGVTATPTLFVNGRPVGVDGNNYEVLKQLVDFAAKEKEK